MKKEIFLRLHICFRVVAVLNMKETLICFRPGRFILCTFTYILPLHVMSCAHVTLQIRYLFFHFCFEICFIFSVSQYGH